MGEDVFVSGLVVMAVIYVALFLLAWLGPRIRKRRAEGTALDSTDLFLAGRSLTHPDQLDRETVVELAKFSALLERTEIASHHPLDGKVCITAFFEASLVIALIGFVATVAFSKYLLRGDIIE